MRGMLLLDGRWHGAPTDASGGLHTLRQLITSSTRVAVVGSSGNLAHRNHGEAIDACDVIIRINAAPTTGFQRDVGSRTHIRVGWGAYSSGGYPEGGFEDAKHDGVITPGELLVKTSSNHFGGQPQWDDRFDWHLGKTHVLLALNSNWAYRLRGALLNDEGAFPSTGFTALVMAAAIAHERGAPPVRVFGFGACPPCPKYYACQTPVATNDRGGHDLVWEANGENGHHPFAAEVRALCTCALMEHNVEDPHSRYMYVWHRYIHSYIYPLSASLSCHQPPSYICISNLSSSLSVRHSYP